MCGVYEYVYVGVCTHTCVQRPDEEVTFPVLLRVITLSFRRVLQLNPELAWQSANPRDSPVFVPHSVGVISLSTPTHSFFHESLGFHLRTSCLHSKRPYPPIPLPFPIGFLGLV